MIRVLISDDHAMFREMLEFALGRDPEIEVVGHAGDGRELVERVARLHPDIALVDYKMPLVRSFRGLIERISGDDCDCRSIVLSGFESDDIARAAAEGGAWGYVLKTARVDSVIAAIKAVSNGAAWVDPSLPNRIFALFQREAEIGRGNGGTGLENLTRRERAVLGGVADGLSNRAIARKLFISEPTVKTHLTHVFAKLNVSNRLAAALIFFGKDEPRSESAP